MHNAARYGACALVACVSLVCAEARGQSTDAFRGAAPFEGTVRDLLRDDLAKTSAQLYGAVGMLERNVVFDLDPGGAVATADFNMLASGLRIPGISEYGTVGDSSYRNQYQLLPADVYAFSAVFAKRWEDLTLFAAAGAVYARVTDGTEATVGRTLFPMIGALSLPIAHLGVMAAPFVTGPLNVTGSQTAADTFSYVYGAAYEAYDVTLYGGLIGTGRGAGFYTNITQERIRLLVEAALTEELDDPTYLKAGISELANLWGLVAGDAELPTDQEEYLEQAREGMTSLYARQVKLAIPRVGGGGGAPSELGFWSAHIEQKNLLPWVDISLAAGLDPEIIVHEAKGTVHSENYGQQEGLTWSLSAGGVQLPALYALGQQPGFRLALRGELDYGGYARVALLRNEPELLASFPYAYDAWAVSARVNLLPWVEALSD